MGYAFNASIYVVGWGDAVQVIDIWFQAQEELDCGIYRHWGDFEARRTYLHDQIVVGLDAGVRGGGVDGVHIGSFQRGKGVIKTIADFLAPVNLSRDFQSMDFRASGAGLSGLDVREKLAGVTGENRMELLITFISLGQVPGAS